MEAKKGEVGDGVGLCGERAALAQAGVWTSVALRARRLLVHLQITGWGSGEHLGASGKIVGGLPLCHIGVLESPASSAYIRTGSAEAWLCSPPDNAK